MDLETLHLLRAARETDLLDALLSDAETAVDAATSAGVDQRAAELVVEALVTEGYLTRVGDGVEPTNQLLGFLAAADLRSVGRLPDALDGLDALVALPETMATGEPPDAGDDHNRLGARLAIEESVVRAAVTAAVRTKPDARRVLVADGAPGRYAAEFAARGYDVTVADEPDAIDAAAKLLARESVEVERVDPDAPLPGGFDLVFAADATVRRTPAENRTFVGCLVDALAGGGTVVLVDRLWGRSTDAVPAAVEAYARDGGGVYDAEAFAEWFEAAGSGAPSVEPVPGTEQFVVAGRAE